MKKRIDRIVIIFLMTASLLCIIEIFTIGSHANYSHKSSNLFLVLFIASLAMMAVGIAWFRYSIKYKGLLVEKDMDTKMAGLSNGARGKIWAYWIVCILLTAVHIAIIALVFIINAQYSSLELRYSGFLASTSVAALAIAAGCLLSTAPYFQHKLAAIVKGVLLGISAASAAAFCYIYLTYLPKYSAENGIRIVRADPAFAFLDIEYPWEYNRYFSGSYRNEGNPFLAERYYYLYELVDYDSDGLHLILGSICFDPVTGAYTCSQGGWQAN